MSAKVLSRKVTNGKAKQRWIQDSDAMRRELDALLDGCGFHIRRGDAYVHFWLDAEYHEEAADIMEVRADSGVVAVQAVAELLRVAKYYFDAAAKVQARVAEDRIKAKVAEEHWNGEGKRIMARNNGK